jgi:hypothetical protein
MFHFSGGVESAIYNSVPKSGSTLYNVFCYLSNLGIQRWKNIAEISKY